VQEHNIYLSILYNDRGIDYYLSCNFIPYSMVCTRGSRYSWTLYSWWWTCVPPETCRVN